MGDTLGEASGRVTINSLGRAGGHERRAVKSVRLLGMPQPLPFQQTDTALVIEAPAKLPTRHACAFKISFHT